MEKNILEKLVAQNLSQRQIATRLHTSQTTIRRRLKKYNLKTIKKEKPTYICVNCGKQIIAKRNRKYKYCSNSCQGEASQKNSLERLKMGTLSDPKTIRATLLRHHNHECQICGRKNWNKQSIPLIADHINGDPYNNNLKNLRLICPNCDAQLPTYMGKNKGNGRHARRERYKNGLSH